MRAHKKIPNDTLVSPPIVDIIVKGDLSGIFSNKSSEKRDGNFSYVQISGYVPVEHQHIEVTIQPVTPMLIDTKSEQINLGINQEEYVKPKSHTLNMGGDPLVLTIASEFYKNDNIAQVFAREVDGDLVVYLVLKHEFKDMAFELASLQNSIQRNHQVFIDIDYGIKEDTYFEELQQDFFKKIPRI